MTNLSAVVTLEQLNSALNNIYNSVPDGTVAAPGLSFVDDQTSGICRNTNGTLSLVAGGKSVFTTSPDGTLDGQIATLGLQRLLSNKLQDSANIKDFGVVDDPYQANVTENSQAYLNAITACSGKRRLVHDADMTVFIMPTVIKVPMHLELNGTLKLAKNSNASVLDLQSSNITISGTGILDGNRTQQQGGVGTALAGISANCSSTSATMPLPPASPIAIADILIEGITIKSTFNWPISLGYITNCRVVGTEMYDGRSSPQFIFSADNCWFMNNFVHDMTDGGFVFYQGNRFCGAIGNIVSNCNDGIGVYCDNDQMSADMNINITGNIVANNVDSGIGITTGGTAGNLAQQRILVGNNVLVNNNTGGRLGGGSIGIVGAQGVEVRNNQIFQDANGTTTGNMAYSIYVSDSSQFITIDSNTIGDVGGTGGGTAIYVNNSLNCAVTNNTIYDTSGTSGTTKVGIGGGFGTGCVYANNHLLGSINGFLDEINKAADTVVLQRGASNVLQISGGINLLSGNISVDQGVVGLSNELATSAGTTQDDAYAVTKQQTIFNAGSANAGARLPSNLGTGSTFVIMNRTGNSMYIYPPAGGEIEGMGLNAGITLANTHTLSITETGSTTISGGVWYGFITGSAVADNPTT